MTSDEKTIESLDVLIPVFNSEKTIGPLVDQVVEALSSDYGSFRVILVNDGSLDQSHEVVLDLLKKHPGVIKYIRLANNFGEHAAVMCGLHQVESDAVVIIDDDFQNPPEEISRLAHKLNAGYDVVYSYYEEKKHNVFRRLGSAFNDRVATWVLGKPKGLYLSSFKAMNAFLVKIVMQYDGPFPYIDGIVLRSTKSIGRELCRHEARQAGQSNYTLKKLLSLWLNMFTGFSIAPLRVASIVGMVMSFAAILLAVLFVISRLTGGLLFKQDIPPGWASLIVSVTFFAGLQLCVLGLIGEYLGRLFMTANRAPQFVVRETHGLDAQ